MYTELYDGIPEIILPSVLEGFRKGSLTDSVGTPQELSEANFYSMRCSFASGSVIEVNGGSLLAGN